MDAVLAPILLFAVFSGVMYYVLLPFLAPIVIATGEESHMVAMALDLRKMSLYRQLREAEFEREMGLIDSADYDLTRTDLMDEVAGVLSAIEAGDAGTAESPAPAVAALAGPSCPDCGAEAESGARFCQQCGAQIGQACPQCGQTTLPEDRFCGSCGRGLIT